MVVVMAVLVVVMSVVFWLPCHARQHHVTSIVSIMVVIAVVIVIVGIITSIIASSLISLPDDGRHVGLFSTPSHFMYIRAYPRQLVHVSCIFVEASVRYSVAPSSFSVVRRFLAQVPRPCGWLVLRSRVF